LKLAGPAHSDRLPFDVARAHALYLGLFRQVEDAIREKHLLIVPSGPLSTLPFQVLVTAFGSGRGESARGHRSIAWMIKSHPITVLPSVGALKSLRRVAGPSSALQPFLGFGNPLLTGPSSTDKSAWSRQSCSSLSGLTQVANRSIRGNFTRFFRGNLADV